MPVKVLSKFDEFQTIINSGEPVVIDFWATWCGPCRMISPILEQLSDNPDVSKVQFYKVDVDEADEIAKDQQIKAMPTFRLYKDGKIVKELVGANPGALQGLVSEGALLV
ncbi:hypothetical protein PC9H_002994 [Pleurotus ostreatus]|uniref:Thioredoxin n=2 Tax=Pleurotus ostreatus TaxID=5322 RepID=A0A067NU68_PLEO1|nr:uncharacterized protein PC9H_002994 [Pleurotus ostreatus]KAF7436168.1 hypothetical protein PC9H_002994 [Pleurotus ostreatus]KAJ8701811.1 hypothetical protein PTI98_000564 [Pleurotus ostreatus]KDQ31449.1 hypothetical protein PLEOSDRAFT_1088775 [Pleurotus ostreatus PC15]